MQGLATTLLIAVFVCSTAYLGGCGVHVGTIYTKSSTAIPAERAPVLDADTLECTSKGFTWWGGQTSVGAKCFAGGAISMPFSGLIGGAIDLAVRVVAPWAAR